MENKKIGKENKKTKINFAYSIIFKTIIMSVLKEPLTLPEACGYQLCVIDILNYIGNHLKKDKGNIDPFELQKYIKNKYDGIKNNVEKVL